MLSEDELTAIEVRATMATQTPNALNGAQLQIWQRIADADVPQLLAEIRTLRALVAGNPAAPEARWRRTVGLFAGDPPVVGDIDAPHILGTPPDHTRPVDNEWRRAAMGAYGVAGEDAP